MSNSLIKAVSGISNFFYKWSLRVTKIAKHRLLTKRKSILLFGQLDNPLYQYLYAQLQSTWQITRVYTTATDRLNGQEPKFEAISAEKEAVAQLNDGLDGKETTKEISTQKKAEAKQVFYKEYFLQDNYYWLEKHLEGKQFDSIVVLPQTFPPSQKFNFEDQNFALEHCQIHQREILRNVFAYRLASKYLTTTGTFILSASERDFLKSQPPEVLTSIKSMREWWASVELIDAQCTYLGVVVGQRDYTDLNSWGLVAMSREWIQQDLQFVGRHYAEWAQGQKLPMPGSFALFKRRAEHHKKPFIEYI